MLEPSGVTGTYGRQWSMGFCLNPTKVDPASTFLLGQIMPNVRGKNRHVFNLNMQFPSSDGVSEPELAALRAEFKA